MSYTKTIKGVEYLVTNELDLASEEFGETFASMHEGAAVIFEEIQEAERDYKETRGLFSLLWESVKNDDYEGADTFAREAGKYARRLAAEAIQAGAMCDKFRRSFKEAEK